MNEDYKCQICGKPATRHYIETVNGIIKERHFCSTCYSQVGVNSDLDSLSSLFSMSNMMSSIFGNQGVKRERLCECGMSEQELLNGYKFGCAECYNVFADIASKMIENIGGGSYKREVVDNGKNTNQQTSNQQETPKSGIEGLIEELNIAIKEERYSDCDKIKKKIDKLRAEQKKEGK